MRVLSDAQIEEVVNYDRHVRAEYERRNRRKMPRITNRYNYITTDYPGSRSLVEIFGGDRPETSKEVCIVNVAVKPNNYNVILVRELAWMVPGDKVVRISGLSYRTCTGWRPEWARRDLTRRSGKGEAAWCYSAGVWPVEEYDYRYNLVSLNRTFDVTINPDALSLSRYRFSGYSDDAPCAVGLMDWLSLYNQEPKIELLAKARLFALVNPQGIKLLMSRSALQWVLAHRDMLARERDLSVRDVQYAIKNNTTIKVAKRHFHLTRRLSREFYNLRYTLAHPDSDSVLLPTRIKFDYTRLAKLLERWGVSADEYGRYVEYAYKAGLDLRNEGTLYPSAKLDREAFLRRMEDLEAAAAKKERNFVKEGFSAQKSVLESFQSALDRCDMLSAGKYLFVVATSQAELRREGAAMRNCIGNGLYAKGVAAGRTVIVLVKQFDGGIPKSFCDIEINRHGWSVRQCYLKANKPAPQELKEIACRIALLLKQVYRRTKKVNENGSK